MIEYVGEVVSPLQMHKRVEMNLKIGQKHYYFMTLQNDQVYPSSLLIATRTVVDFGCDTKGQLGPIHESQLQPELCDTEVDCQWKGEDWAFCLESDSSWD